MLKNFSGVIQVNDLDDFIGPGVECVKPVPSSRTAKSSKISISSENDPTEIGEVKRRKPVEKAQISLDDCLACSGCVTSAESVLINQQSIDEIIKVMENNSILEKEGKSNEMKLICISISPQSQASLANRYNMDLKTCVKKLCKFFKQYFSASYVFDTSFSRDFSIRECQKEFVDRYKNQNNQNQQLPIIASACPGWICYAEKTHGFILPYISTVKSPQQIMGSLVKDYVYNKLKNVTSISSPRNIYHVTVMPCFDKKLESSRKEFYNEAYHSKDVDCVLSSLEIEKIIEKESIDLGCLDDDELNIPFLTENIQIDRQTELYNPVGGGSDGYAENVLIYAAKHLFNVDLKPSDIIYKQLKNVDFNELSFEINGECKLKFAKAYGFRNIQSIVQKIKKNGCQYQYVEIMACPLGCLNGGGQIRDTNSNTLNKETFEKVNELYNSVVRVDVDLSKNEIFLAKFYQDEWLKGDEASIKHHLHTSYHEIEKNVNNLTIKW